jgi:hypothetical protein
MKKYSPGFEWSYRDLLFTMMVAYMAMAAMALIVTSKIAKVESVSPGNILIELFWDKNKNADVDLWVKAPGERPVGYSNKSGVVFNLLRDDLGTSSDPESRNQELVVGRGLHQGEYIVNVHMYHARDSGSVDAIVKISIDRSSTQGPNLGPSVIALEKVTFTRNGEELTVVRFTLDREGYLVRNSINKVFRELRNANVGISPPLTNPPNLPRTP